jgi:transcriptional regulator with XRE-family HTH domain
MSARALRRIRDELDARGISQRDLALLLTNATEEHWSQPRIGKVLTGKVELKLDDAAAIARVIKLALTEILRDRGLEFYAELTPTELRILERIRQRPHVLSALLILLDITPPPKDPNAVNLPPRRRKLGRPRNSELGKTVQAIPLP